MTMLMNMIMEKTVQWKNIILALSSGLQKCIQRYTLLRKRLSLYQHINMWCACLASPLLLELQPFLLDLRSHLLLHDWLPCSEALSSRYCWATILQQCKWKRPTEGQRTNNLPSYWETLKKVPPSCSQNICRKIQLGFELGGTWRMRRTNNYHCSLILKYKKIRKAGPKTASLNCMVLHTIYSQV